MFWNLGESIKFRSHIVAVLELERMRLHFNCNCKHTDLQRSLDSELFAAKLARKLLFAVDDFVCGQLEHGIRAIVALVAMVPFLLVPIFVIAQ